MAAFWHLIVFNVSSKYLIIEQVDKKNLVFYINYAVWNVFVLWMSYLGGGGTVMAALLVIKLFNLMIRLWFSLFGAVLLVFFMQEREGMDVTCLHYAKCLYNCNCCHHYSHYFYTFFGWLFLEVCLFHIYKCWIRRWKGLGLMFCQTQFDLLFLSRKCTSRSLLMSIS